MPTVPDKLFIFQLPLYNIQILLNKYKQASFFSSELTNFTTNILTCWTLYLCKYLSYMNDLNSSDIFSNKFIYTNIYIYISA